MAPKVQKTTPSKAKAPVKKTPMKRETPAKTKAPVAKKQRRYLDQAQAQQAAQRSAGAPLDKSKPNLEKLFASYRSEPNLPQCPGASY